MYFILIISTILYSSISFSSFFEDFGASTSSLGLGGQSNLYESSPSTNYYLPAAMAYNRNIKIEFSSFASSYNIKPIDDIVIENSINTSSGSEKIGSVDNDFTNLYTNSLHVSLPIAKMDGSINLSLISPFPFAAQFDTGDPYTPEYSLIKARPRRIQGFINLAYAINNNIAFSLGAHLGAKVESEFSTKASVNNDDNLYTYASGAGEVTPQISPVVSMLYKIHPVFFGLYFQGEMESSLRVDLAAEEIFNGLVFDSILDTILYYDPATFKFQFSWNMNNVCFLNTSINYYRWKNYQTPKINITQLAAVTGTYNYETLKIRNTISPRIGLSYYLSDQKMLNIGLAYKQSPLKGNFSGNGNTIHSDSYILSMSPTVKFERFGYMLKASLGVAHEILENMRVTKESGQENGLSGRKIGSPGFDIGGNITTVSIGLEIEI